MTTTKCKKKNSPRTNQINLKSFPLLLSAIYHRLKVWPVLGFGWCDRRLHSSETTSSLIFALGQAIIANLSRQALLPPVCPVLQFKSNINFLYFTNSRTAVHSQEWQTACATGTVQPQFPFVRTALLPRQLNSYCHRVPLLVINQQIFGQK